MAVVEIRIHVLELEWKDTPVVARLIVVDGLEAVEVQPKALTLAYVCKRTVRWNVEGSLEGHYVGSAFEEEGGS